MKKIKTHKSKKTNAPEKRPDDERIIHELMWSLLEIERRSGITIDAGILRSAARIPADRADEWLDLWADMLTSDTWIGDAVAREAVSELFRDMPDR